MIFSYSIFILITRHVVPNADDELKGILNAMRRAELDERLLVVVTAPSLSCLLTRTLKNN